jgi:hypothetical protein
LTATGFSKIALKSVGFAVLFALFAANLYVLYDAINFELGEKLGPACTYIRHAGIHPALLFFLIQLIPIACLSLYLRSWFVFSLAVFPLWALLYSACMVLD